MLCCNISCTVCSDNAIKTENDYKNNHIEHIEHNEPIHNDEKDNKKEQEEIKETE